MKCTRGTSSGMLKWHKQAKWITLKTVENWRKQIRRTVWNSIKFRLEHRDWQRVMWHHDFTLTHSSFDRIVWMDGCVCVYLFVCMFECVARRHFPSFLTCLFFSSCKWNILTLAVKSTWRQVTKLRWNWKRNHLAIFHFNRFENSIPISHCIRWARSNKLYTLWYIEPSCFGCLIVYMCFRHDVRDVYNDFLVFRKIRCIWDVQLSVRCI